MLLFEYCRVEKFGGFMVNGLRSDSLNLLLKLTIALSGVKVLVQMMSSKPKQKLGNLLTFGIQIYCSIRDRVLLLPTTPGAAPLLNTSASELSKYRTSLLALTIPASLTKAPQINLPYLSSEQAPWGVSLMSLSGCDRALLDCAGKLDKL